MKLFRIIIILLLIFISSGISASSLNKEVKNNDYAYVKANVYFYNWGYISDKYRRIAETRQNHNEYLQITGVNLLKRFLDLLDLENLRQVKNPQPHHALLVIDLYKEDGSMTTYYSDGCDLYSSNSEYSRVVSKAFRKQFDFLGESMIFHIGKGTYNLCEK